MRDFQHHFRLDSPLGSGGYGHVFKAIRLCDSAVFACKIIPKRKVSNLQRDPDYGLVPFEVYVLKNYKHPHIIEFVDYFQNTHLHYIITTIHGNLDNNINSGAGTCDLFHQIEQRAFTEDEAKYIFRQLIEVVSFLDSNCICHSDVKDENILIDKNNNIKLIDFGSCFFLNTRVGKDMKVFYGTYQYAPPEVVKRVRYYNPRAAEIWKLGCCLYVILVRRLPFGNSVQILEEEISIPKNVADTLSEDCKNLLFQMLDKNPDIRPCLEDIKNHSWLKQ